MYMKSCLLKNRDNVVSCIKTLSLCRVPCVSVPPILSYISLKVVEQRLKMWGCYCLHCSVLWPVGVIVYIVVCCGVKRNLGDVFM